MLEMYAPMVNSPITELATAIDDTQTTIEVVDGSKLPDAPNLAMIGLGENTETILYTQKDGNVLSGVTRGFQGVAKAWPQGTRVARFFAAYDQMAIQENIKTLDQSLATHLNDLAHFNPPRGLKKIDIIVPVGGPGEWDEKIREIGNILYDPDDPGKEYKLFYSGYQGDYLGNNVYVGYAYSSDGKIWTKGGQLNIGRSAEDPYVVKHNGIYYLYVEDKEVVPFRNIRLFTSTDFVNWTDQGVVLDVGTGWESQDVSSPTVFVEDGIFYMFYEGRAPGQEGAVGLATSQDGITWTKYNNNPVVKPNNPDYFANPDIHWTVSVVPDDIKVIGEFYQMKIHVQMKNHIGIEKWVPGILISKNKTSWVDCLGLPISVPDSKNVMIDTIMFAPDGLYIFADESGIWRGLAVENKSLTYIRNTVHHTGLSTNQWSKVDWFDEVIIDSRSEFDVATQKFVAKYSGLYSFKVRVTFAGIVNDASRLGISITINGVEADILLTVTTGSALPHTLSGETFLYLFGGDEVEIHYYTTTENPNHSIDYITFTATQIA